MHVLLLNAACTHMLKTKTYCMARMFRGVKLSKIGGHERFCD